MAGAHDPVELIRGRLAEWGTAFVELDVFGTDDPAQIVRLTDEFCRLHLGAPLAASLFYVSSVGSAHGVRLLDGRELVIKARPPAHTNPDHSHDVSGLESVCRVLSWLHARGYPCAAVVLGPTPLASGVATVEEFFERGERGDGFHPPCRTTIAGGLADLVELLRGCGAEAAGVRRIQRPVELYPQPHARIFDFKAPAAGTAWIDDFARRARRIDDAAGAPVLGHNDWRVEHLRFGGEAIVATYDWDSLAFLPETALVGGSAHGFTADWSRPVRRIPTADDIRAYVADYEAGRGRAFSRRERSAVFAHCVYSIAYGARCQHALEPARLEWEPDSFPYLLRTAGDALLAEAG
jgi:hypothetical protein